MAVTHRLLPGSDGHTVEIADPTTGVTVHVRFRADGLISVKAPTGTGRQFTVNRAWGNEVVLDVVAAPAVQGAEAT